MSNTTRTAAPVAPSQDDINAAFLATLQRLDERMDRVVAATQQTQQTQQPQPKVPVIKTEDLVSGRAGIVGETILERASRMQAAEAALSLGLYEEPEEALSAWEIAGIACGAALLGAGVAVGVSYALNADSDEG